MKPKFYAVASGRSQGVFRSWDECSQATNGFKGAVFKSFKTESEAAQFISANNSSNSNSNSYSDSRASSYGSSKSNSYTPSNSSTSSVNTPVRNYAKTATKPSSYSQSHGSFSLTDTSSFTPSNSSSSSSFLSGDNTSSPSSSSAPAYRGTGSFAQAEAEPTRKRKTSPTSAPASASPNIQSKSRINITAAVSSANYDAANQQVDRLVSQARYKGDVVCFVDGASKRNPGSSGSGIVVEVPLTSGQQLKEAQDDPNYLTSYKPDLNRRDALRLDVSLALGSASNNYAEMTGLEYTMKYLDTAGEQFKDFGETVTTKGKDVYVFSDSNWAINIIAGTWKVNDAYAEQAQRIRNHIIDYEEKNNCNVYLQWVKGHATTAGNILADKLATNAAQYCEEHRIKTILPEPKEVYGSKMSSLRYAVDENETVHASELHD